MTARRPLTLFLAVTALFAALLLSGVGTAEAKPGFCAKLPFSVKLSSKDPTAMLEGGAAWVYVRPGASVFGPQVIVRRGNQIFASGRVSGRMASGRTTVVKLKLRRTLTSGRYRVVTKARKGGCSVRRAKHRGWVFNPASLPVTAAPFSTRVGDNRSQVRLVLRPVGQSRIGQVRVFLKNANGANVAQTVVPDLSAVTDQQGFVSLPIVEDLKPGRYKVLMIGENLASGEEQQTTDAIRFVSGGSGAASIVDSTGQMLQRVRVNWHSGQWQGRDTAGFVVPGIGYGEIVCRPNQQWIRFYPSDRSREAAMMNWTWKDWGQWQEHSIREAKYTENTGPDFREGLNKWSPSEKWSTGEFRGLISDRGTINGGFGENLAEPTGLLLDWEWDFTRTGQYRCGVEAEFRTGKPDNNIKPLARSIQIVWRGEGNASGHDEASINLPDLGEIKAICKPGPSGVRRLEIDKDSDNPVGGSVSTWEGSDDQTVTQEDGPLTPALPNNGMLFVHLNSGERILVSSRWKANDPEPSRNWCVVSAQIYTP